MIISVKKTGSNDHIDKAKLVQIIAENEQEQIELAKFAQFIKTLQNKRSFIEMCEILASKEPLLQILEKKGFLNNNTLF